MMRAGIKNFIGNVIEKIIVNFNSYLIISYLLIFFGYLFYFSYVFYIDVANNLLTQANIFRQNFEQKLTKYSNILDVVGINIEQLSISNIAEITKTLKLAHEITFADEDFQNSTINWLTNERQPKLITPKGILQDNYFRQQVTWLPNMDKTIVIINRNFTNDLWVNSAMLCKATFNHNKQYLGITAIQFSLDALYQGITKGLNTNYYNFIIIDKDQNPLFYDHFTLYTKIAKAVSNNISKKIRFSFLNLIKNSYIILPTKNIINNANYTILAKINYEYLYNQLFKLLLAKGVVFLLQSIIMLYLFGKLKQFYDKAKFIVEQKVICNQQQQVLTLTNENDELVTKLTACQTKLLATETAMQEFDLFAGEYIRFYLNNIAVKLANDNNLYNVLLAKIDPNLLMKVVSVTDVFDSLIHLYEKVLIEKRIILTIDNQVKYTAPLQILFNFKYFMVLVLNNTLDFAAEQSNILIKLYPIIENKDNLLLNIDIIDFHAFTQVTEEPPLRLDNIAIKFSAITNFSWETIEKIANILKVKLIKTFNQKNKTISICFPIIKTIANNINYGANVVPIK